MLLRSRALSKHHVSWFTVVVKMALAVGMVWGV